MGSDGGCSLGYTVENLDDCVEPASVSAWWVQKTNERLAHERVTHGIERRRGGERWEEGMMMRRGKRGGRWVWCGYEATIAR